MTWLTWRQHRAEVFALTVTVAVISVLLGVVALPVHALFPDGAAACLSSTTDACDRALTALYERMDGARAFTELLVAVPLVIGVFLGAPLLARELESGTWQLAWTQGVPRMRWLAVKLSCLAAVTVILTAAFTAVLISSSRSRSRRRFDSPNTPRIVTPSTPMSAMKRINRSKESRSRLSSSRNGVARIG